MNETNDQNRGEEDDEERRPYEPGTIPKVLARLAGAFFDLLETIPAWFVWWFVSRRRDEASDDADPAEERSSRLSGWIGWIVAIMITWTPLGLYQFYAPFSRVVDSTWFAGKRAVHREMHRPSEIELTRQQGDAVSRSILTVFPEVNRGEVYESVLRWLEIHHPELDLKARINEMDALDRMLRDEVRCIAFSKAESKREFLDPKIPPLRVMRTCLAGDPRSPWLVLALGRDDMFSQGLAFAVACDGEYYHYSVLNDDATRESESVVQRGRPWVTAADLDMDGSDEIITAWRSDFNRSLSLQVHKHVSDWEWKRVMSLSDLYLGQTRVARPDPSAAPELIVADGVAPEKGQSTHELVTYIVSAYSWDKTAGTLRKTREYQSDTEFDPMEAHGTHLIKSARLPEPVKKSLEKRFKDGWCCTSARSIGTYLILTVFDREMPEDAKTVNVVVVDTSGRVRLSRPGLVFNPGGLYHATDLDGDGRAEAVIESEGGGARGRSEYFVCRFYPKFGLLAYVDAGRGYIEGVRDLDGDGLKEIVMRDDCFEEFDNAYCSDTPRIPLVLRYSRGRYRAATGDYPGLVRADMEQTREALKCALAGVPTDDNEYPTDSLALLWYADAVLLGEQESAYKDIVKILPGEEGLWLRRNRADATAVVRMQGSRVLSRVPPSEGP